MGSVSEADLDRRLVEFVVLVYCSAFAGTDAPKGRVLTILQFRSETSVQHTVG